MGKVRRCRYEGCHTIVDRPSYYCEEHKQHEAEYAAQRERYSRKRYNKYTRNRSEDKAEQYNFYRTRQWTHKRLAILSRDNYLCQYCKANGKLTANSKTVDHVTPYEVDGGLKLDDNNLATTCRACHNVKTKLEQKLYGTGQGNEPKNKNIRLSVATWAAKIKHAQLAAKS